MPFFYYCLNSFPFIFFTLEKRTHSLLYKILKQMSKFPAGSGMNWHHTRFCNRFLEEKKEPETSSQDSWEYVKFTACLHTHLKRCYQPACNICLNQQNHNSSYFIAFLLAIDCFKVIRAEIAEEEPFEESIPHPKTLVGWLIVNYVNNEVYPQMDLRTNFTMKTTSYKTIFTRIHPSTHTFANSDIYWNWKTKKWRK